MHPSETIQLEGIGPHVAGLLTDKLKAYCQENGLPMPPPPAQGRIQRFFVYRKPNSSFDDPN